MIHSMWSVFFLLLIIMLVMAYVVSFSAILYMVHYIAVNNWRVMAVKEKTNNFRVVAIGGKFFLYLLVSAGIAWSILCFEYYSTNELEGYGQAGIAMVCNRSILIFLAGVFLCLLLNTIKITRNNYTNQYSKTKFSSYFRGRLFKNTILFCLVCMLTVYTVQWAKWTGKDNANLEAKQYWVAGQVLEGFRAGLTIFIHPEISVMAPANSLQKWIYDKGSKYLPENDGERGVWQNSWFHYHYSRKGRRPMFAFGHKPSPRTVTLLDRWWFCLETMAKRQFADQQMWEEHYLRDYVSLAISYTSFEGFYSGKTVQSHSRMAQIPEHVQRSRLLSQWLWELHEEWQSSESMLRFLKKHPKLEAMYQYVQSFELDDIITGEIYSRTFDCKNQSISRYIAIRKEFAEGKDGVKPAYRRMKSKDQSERLYRLIVSYTGARSVKYVIEHYCGYEVPGKADISYYESFAKSQKISTEEMAEDSAKANYADELRILEEIYHGKRD